MTLHARLEGARCVRALVRGGDEEDELAGALLVVEFFDSFRGLIRGLTKKQ